VSEAIGKPLTGYELAALAFQLKDAATAAVERGWRGKRLADGAVIEMVVRARAVLRADGSTRFDEFEATAREVEP
jgi:hypothetical protein